MDIFEALEAEGVDISYSTVLRAIRRIENKAKEAYTFVDWYGFLNQPIK